MYDVTYTDVDEDKKLAYAEIMLELNIGYHLEQDLQASLGFMTGIKKNATFQNFELEWSDDGTIRIFFQIEQDASDELP